MKYTKQERLDIGRLVYEKKMSREEAAVRYILDPYTVRDYYRLYKATLNVEEDKRKGRASSGQPALSREAESG